MTKWKLESVVRSDRPAKKWKATFIRPSTTGKKIQKTIHFGAKGMDDYTITKDEEQRARYRRRHARDQINNPLTPGSLSWFLLWGDSTSMKQNIKEFKHKFSL